jgi:hypothetical protein
MRWLVLICGGIATAAMIAISMRLNFLFGAALGQTPEKALVFGCISVVGDAWKGLGPIFIVTLMRDRRVSALAASMVWFACFIFSLSSGLGIAIQDRTSVTGGRESLRANYADAHREIEELEGKRRGLPHHRPAGEIEAAIAALLAEPVGTPQRLRGNVASISANCTKVDARTVKACADVAVLRQELAIAVEEGRLDEPLAELRQRARTLRERGAGQVSDPQAELLSRLTRGWLSAHDVAPGLALLLACVVELVSAFGPVVLAAYADATLHSGGRQGNEGSATVDYMIARIEPSDGASPLTVDTLYADYKRWCDGRKRKPFGRAAFIGEFDRSRVEHGLENIQKIDNSYYGIRLAEQAP